MHVLAFHVDLPVLLQFAATAGVLLLGLLYLVKSAAAKYFVVDAKFEEAGSRRGQMISGAAACFVCSGAASKRCSGCKAVRYCSTTCQSQHWKEDHKNKCREMRFSAEVDSQESTSNISDKRRTKWVNDFRPSTPLVVTSRTCKELKQPQKVLFPYDEFVKLFNWESPGFPPCGLLNCGNSCFANVILQCLACTRPLVGYLLEGDHARECRRNDWCFLCELQCHIRRVWHNSQPFSPLNILSRLPSIGGNLGCGKQEDAHEFMRFAVDTMQSVCLDEFGGEKSLESSIQETTLIQHIFGGSLESEVICTKCDKISHRHENMMDLTVEIQGNAASLEDCLNQFTVKEWLDGDNMYKCDGCNDYVKACKQLTVRQAPNIVTIALKRFQSGRFGKLNKPVTFPEMLDLGPYMRETSKGTDLYRLYAVVVHVDMLNASFFGHYICYTKDFDGNWYRIDDCKVTNVELEEVLAQGAYMLLYSRVHVRQPCMQPLEQKGKESQPHQTDRNIFQKGMNSSEPSGSFSLVDSSSPLSGLPPVGNGPCDEPKSSIEFGSQMQIKDPVDVGQQESTIQSGSQMETKESVDVNLDYQIGRLLKIEDPESLALNSYESKATQSNEDTGEVNHFWSRSVEGESSISVSSTKISESSEKALNALECVQLNISNKQEENGMRSHRDINSSLPQFSSDHYLTNGSVLESATKGNILSHRANGTCYRVGSSGNLPSLQNGMGRVEEIGSLSSSLNAEARVAEIEVSESCGAKLKPLFSPGFPDISARKKVLAKVKKATGEHVYADGPPKMNGLTEPGLPLQNGAEVIEIPKG